MKEKILLTGVSGFVGNYLARYFLEKMFPLVGIGRRDTIEIESLKNKYNNFQYLKNDLIKPLEYNEEVDVIIHCASQSPFNCRSLSQYIDGNIISTRNIVNYAKKWKPKLIIYLSGISIYGKVQTEILNEKSDIINSDFYGQTKFLSEGLFMEDSLDVPVMILRLPGILGKGAHSCWLAKVVKKMKNHESISYFNADNLFNNCIHLLDLSCFVQNIITMQFDRKAVLNLASVEPKKIIDILNFIKVSLKSDSILNEIQADLSSFVISTKKAESEFGFLPRSVIDTIKMYLEDSSYDG